MKWLAIIFGMAMWAVACLSPGRSEFATIGSVAMGMGSAWWGIYVCLQRIEKLQRDAERKP